MSAGKKELVLLILLASPVLFGGLASTALLDPDEGMYGTIAKEMVAGGDWITPHFNGIRYLNKPPLYFWLTAATIGALGPSEWAVRLWSALPCLGAALLVWRLGRLVYGGRAGLLSAMVMVSGVGVFRYVRVAATDFLLVFSITLALYGFVRSYLNLPKTDRPLTSGAILFYLGMALGVLSKGLIGVLLPVLIIGLFSFITVVIGQRSLAGAPREMMNRLRPTLYAPLGIVLFLLLVLPWHLLAAWKNPGFFEFYVIDNQFLRFLNHRGFIEDDISVTTLSFLLLTLLWFFPWSLFLPAALRQGFSLKQPLRWLIGLWALVVLGFFSLSGSKLEHYFLPAIPALSLMVGSLWDEAFWDRRGSWSFRWSLGVGAGGCLVVGLALLFFGGLLTPEALMAGLAELNVYYRILQEQGVPFPFPSIDPFVGWMRELGAVLIIGSVLSGLFFYWGRLKFNFISFVVVFCALAVLVVQLDRLVEPQHSTKETAAALTAHAGFDDLIIHEDSLEYSGGLPFYSGKKVMILNGRDGSLDFGSRFPDAAPFFINGEGLRRIWGGGRRIFLVTASPPRQSEVRNLARSELFSVGRYGSRQIYTNQPFSSIADAAGSKFLISAKK